MKIFAAQHVGLRPYQEDRYIFKEYDKYIISAIFDGHGGSQCSEKLKNMYTNKFNSLYNKYNKNIHKALLHSSRELNNDFLKEKMQCGSTANVLVIDKTSCKFYVSNTGDSRTVVSYNNSKIKQPSIDHKIKGNKHEQRSIISRGGSIKNGRVCGVLNLSRAFGNYSICKYISSQPDVFLGCYVDFEFILQASDGLFDFMTNKEICNIIRKLLHKGQHPRKILKRLLDIAYNKKGSDDNISIILMIKNKYKKIHK